MDTSEQYIKMCDCSEVQSPPKKKDHRSADSGDFFTRNIHGKWFIEIQSDNMTDLMEWARDSYEERHEIPEKHWDKILRNTIWLPRQDQIQNMMEIFLIKEKNMGGVWAMEQYFHEWFLNKAKIETCATREQLWLSCYMCEKYKKTWDGKEWIKINQNKAKEKLGIKEE